jgi:hypothetical protein
MCRQLCLSTVGLPTPFEVTRPPSRGEQAKTARHFSRLAFRWRSGFALNATTAPNSSLLAASVPIAPMPSIDSGPGLR